MGYGLPYPEAALPRSVPKMIHAMIHECGVPSEWLEWHGHNDFHKVLVNATTAWLYGCAAANCTLLGFGERTGNPPLEGAIMDYIALRGDANGIDTRVITEIADYFRTEIGVTIPDGLSVRRRRTSTSPARASTPTACSRTRRSTTSSTRTRSSTGRRG